MPAPRSTHFDPNIEKQEYRMRRLVVVGNGKAADAIPLQ
jgi:hypothetical protein